MTLLEQSGGSVDRLIFLNIPVADLVRSRTFYAGLGFAVDPRFSDHHSVCVVISPTICAMLLEQSQFAETHSTAKLVNSLSASSPIEVDQLVEQALATGGSPWRDKVDHGGMYGHSFTDPDGHVWELLHLDLCCGP